MISVVVKAPPELSRRMNRYPKGKWSDEGKIVHIMEDRYYTRGHMWVKKTPEGYFRIGITDYAQKVLQDSGQADIAIIEIYKKTGEEVEAGELFGTIYGTYYVNFDYMGYETMAFDLTAPVSGEIVEVNTRVIENPVLINTDPYGEGWIITIAPKGDVYELISPIRYKKILTQKEKSPFRIM